MEHKTSIFRLIEELARLPGIGRKTAERLAFYILKEDQEVGESIARAILEVKKKIKFCSICGNITEQDPCAICTSPHRNKKIICVTEEPRDIWTIEKSGSFKGVYHVLMGALSPLDGVGPEKLRIKELLGRVKDAEVEEIIIATDPNVEGDATALYISRILKPLGVKVSRLASGLPAGGDLEYADSVTLSKALSGRTPL